MRDAVRLPLPWQDRGDAVVTKREEHPGGWHGRHVLETPVTLEQEAVAALSLSREKREGNRRAVAKLAARAVAPAAAWILSAVRAGASWDITEVGIYARRLRACLAAMVGCPIAECCWLSR